MTLKAMKRTASWYRIVLERFDYLESTGDIYDYLKLYKSPMIENCSKSLFKSEAWLCNL